MDKKLKYFIVFLQAAGDVALTPVQCRLKQQLLQKHQQLQEAILRQQEELKFISEQLNLSTPPTIPSGHLPAIGKFMHL